tara:strand:- start:2411 stop:2779 length:369 start_codon:yes stop_codon:yes gene_type:complete
MKIEVSIGEVLDKISILEIKNNKIKDHEKLKNIKKEFDILTKYYPKYKDEPEYNNLLKINSLLWEIEDRLRLKEKSKVFDEEFIKLARDVYFTNDKRSEIKKDINVRLGSNLIEEKSYKKYS